MDTKLPEGLLSMISGFYRLRKSLIMRLFRNSLISNLLHNVAFRKRTLAFYC